MKVTACECVEPGWCERHRCFKDELDFQLCRRRPDYFRAWEEGRGPGQGETGSARGIGSARGPDAGSDAGSARDPDVGSARVSDPAETADRRSPPPAWAASVPARLPCRHRGAVIGTRECPACKGRVRLKLFRCTIHGSCTTIRSWENTACCARCDGYEAPILTSGRE